MTHPFPLLESPPTSSRRLKPNARKTSFSKQKVFVLENVLPGFGKYIGLPSEANYWIVFPKQSWVSLRDELLDNSSSQFFGKFSLEIPFTNIFHFSFLSLSFTFFHFLSCHALTPNILGCPSAYGMHYAISKQFMQRMPIYHHAYIDKIHIHTTCYLIHINNIKISSLELIKNPIPMSHTQLYFI